MKYFVKLYTEDNLNEPVEVFEYMTYITALSAVKAAYFGGFCCKVVGVDSNGKVFATLDKSFK